MVTVEGVRLRMPPLQLAVDYLDAAYGSDWNANAVVCGGHKKFSNFQSCDSSQSPTSRTQVMAAIESAPACKDILGLWLPSTGTRLEDKVKVAAATAATAPP